MIAGGLEKLGLGHFPAPAFHAFFQKRREVRNLLGRISTHARLRKLLANPADAATLNAWCDRALKLAPLDPQARAETAFVRKLLAGAPGGGSR